MQFGRLHRGTPWAIRLAVGIGLGALHAAAAWAAPPAAPNKDASPSSERATYIRLTRDENGTPLALQTAVASFRPVAGESKLRVDGKPIDLDGARVDLVAAVHIGEGSYYDALNKLFADYDVVLYELVAPEGTRVPAGGGGANAHPISLMQNGMRSMLQLESQLERVDYQKSNFVHADMSPEQFSSSMKNRGETVMTMFFRMLGTSLAQQARQAVEGGKSSSATSDLAFLGAMLNRKDPSAIKRALAEQFESLEGTFEALSGPEGSTIITDRNAVALAELGRQLATGKRKIAVFYGAAHLGDMQSRLENDFGLERTGDEWLTAWDLVARPAVAKPTEK